MFPDSFTTFIKSFPIQSRNGRITDEFEASAIRGLPRFGVTRCVDDPDKLLLPVLNVREFKGPLLEDEAASRFLCGTRAHGGFTQSRNKPTNPRNRPPGVFSIMMYTLDPEYKEWDHDVHKATRTAIKKEIGFYDTDFVVLHGVQDPAISDGAGSYFVQNLMEENYAHLFSSAFEDSGTLLLWNSLNWTLEAYTGLKISRSDTLLDNSTSGSFSALSTPIFASKYTSTIFCSIF